MTILNVRAASSKSSSSHVVERNRRRVAMSPLTLSPAALLLLRGASAQTPNHHTATTIPDPASINWAQFAIDVEKMSNGGNNTNHKAERTSLTQHSFEIDNVEDNSTPIVTPQPTTSAPTALPSQSPTTSNPTNLPTPFPTTASPTPAPSTTELTPAPTTASQTPAPTTASSTPVPTTASPTPVPTTASPTPLPITASPTPLPMTATPTSLPTTATPTPLPTQREQLKIMGCGNNGDWKTKDGCAYPLLECTGDCDTNNDCAGDLICHQREPYEAVPGCSGGEQHDSKTDFCVRPSGGDGVTRDAGGDGPSPPTYAPNTFGATYVPGDLSQPCDGGKVMLSKGMDCRLLTTAGRPVQYDTGGQSTEVMHARADGAAVIPHPTDGGWYYTSNSEVGSGGGGVGTLRFNAQGEVIGYKMDLQNTSDNCGGGECLYMMMP